MATQTIFVTGVTGTQGGAVAREALKRGWHVRALVRDPDAPAAKALTARGAQLVPGDYDNAPALEQALAGCTAVFLALTPSFADLDAELRWARAILTAATGAAASSSSVQMVVSSTVVGVDRPERFGSDPNPAFVRITGAKAHVEEAVRSSAIPHWTLLRPANFMANYVDPRKVPYMCPGLVDPAVRTWTTALQPHTRLPLVDDRDIGRFVIAAIADPARFHGRAIELAGELKTPGAIVAALAQVTGLSQLDVAYLPEAEVQARRKTDPFVAGVVTMRTMEQYVDLDKVRSYGVPLGTFEAYLEREKETVRKTYGIL